MKRAFVIVGEHLSKFSTLARTSYLAYTARDFTSLVETMRRREVEKAARAMARGAVMERLTMALCSKISHPVLSSPDDALRDEARRIGLIHFPWEDDPEGKKNLQKNHCHIS